MKSELLVEAVGGIDDALIQRAEKAPAPVLKLGWVKWAAAAACLVLAALIGIPAIMHSQVQAEAVPDRSLPAEAIITDDVRTGITNVLTNPNDCLVAEDNLTDVTLGLPIAEYGLYLDDDGNYYLNASEYRQVYPVYVNGAFTYLVGCGPTGEWGYYEPYLVTSDNKNEGSCEEVLPWHKVLYDMLTAGDAGTVALVYAADGSYLYDGSTFMRVSDTGIGNGADYDAQFDENGNFIDWPEASVAPPQKTNPAALDDVNLPDELIAEIRLTDTSITEPLVP